MSVSLRLHGYHSPWNSPGQNTGVGSLSLLQGTLPTQGLNSGLPHYRRILYQLSHQGSPTRKRGGQNCGGLELAAELTWTALPNSALWKSVNATNEDFSPEPMIYVFVFVFFQPSNAACAILVPWPETEPMSSAVKAYSPNYWTAREFPVINIHWHSTGEGPGDLW